MSVLTAIAIVLQLADAGQTCAALRGGAREGNPLLGAHPGCGRVLALKGAQLAPLALPLPGKLRAGVQIGNVAAGGGGVALSAVLYWGRR